MNHPILAQAEVTALAPYLAGPGAAVTALMVVLAGLYALVVKQIMPLANRALDAHLTRIDTLIKQSQDMSHDITRTLASIDKRLARLEGHTDGGQFIQPNPGALSPDRST